MERILSELEGFSRGSLNSVETQVTTADGRKVSPCSVYTLSQCYVKPPRTNQTLYAHFRT